MARRNRGIATGQNAIASTVAIPPAILKKLAAAKAVERFPAWHERVIIEQYGIIECRELAKILGRSTSSIAAAARELRGQGIKIGKYYNRR